MKRRQLALAIPLALGLVVAAGAAAGEDLMEIYRLAQQYDPAIAAARANWQATQEKLPQARSGLLPIVSASGTANANIYDATIRTDPRQDISRNYTQGSLTISASQPLFRYQNLVAYDQAKQVVTQADYTLGSAQQDLIVRVAVAYFDVLLAQFNVELSVSQKAAVSEQLAQAKRNFEVGVATITDTNEAQAKYDQIVASEIATRNDLDNKNMALLAITGRMPKSLKRLGPGFDPSSPDPNSLDVWVERALKENLAVRSAQASFDIATLEVECQRAGHYPTLDLVGSYGGQASSGGVNYGVNSDSRSGLIGLSLNVPIYQGGFVNSKVAEALALQESARQSLEGARRAAQFGAQTGFAGVNSAVASVKAFEQAVASAQSAYESNKLGQEVGVRTNLDVLNTQQNVFSARRDLAGAYFNYLIGVLRLKSAVGTLQEQDLEDLNRRLSG
jgi:outer membrane protein